MRKLLLLLPLFVLCSCGTSTQTSTQINPPTKDNANSTNNGIITQQINKSNFQKYLRMEVVDLSNSFQHNEKIVFNGAISFATYEVKVKYSGIDWDTAIEGTWTLDLDIGGGGETKKINGNVKIEDVFGTCTYRYQ